MIFSCYLFKGKIIYTKYIMSNIEIKNCIFKVHPVYDLYAADEAGNVVNIVKKDCITVGTSCLKIAQVRHSFCSAVSRAITAEFQNGGFPLCRSSA